MHIGAVADIHGNFDALRRAMARHPDVPAWLCVGDLASRAGAYPDPIAPLYWIKGNNENFDRIAEWEAGVPQPRHLHFIANGTAMRVGPLYVAGLGGTFAPTWFDTAAADLPHTPKDDKRRHFVREEVERCRHLRGIDVLMTHEAPRPFVLVDDPSPGRTARRRDAGKPAINGLLAALAPRLHLCGHHHRFTESVREGVRSVCIDRINRSYLLIDADTLTYEQLDNRGDDPAEEA
jgi:Icc-related predicted phosphoesterase